VATEKHRWPQGGRGTYKAAAPATVYHYTKAVKTLMNWAEAEEYLLQNPVARLKIRPPHYKEVHPYSDDEVRAMLLVCEDDIKFGYRYLGIRNKAIISLFISTGLRLEELSNIGLSDFDPRLQQLEVLGKGQKVRVVPVNGEAKKALRRYLEFRPKGGEALWLSLEGQPMTFYGVRVMVNRLKRRAGVVSDGGAHRFRHYFATRYLEGGGDLNSLRLLLGHATLAMVLRYSKYASVSRALSQHPQFDPLDRLLKGDINARRWRY
jgi:integrase/recombinase XerD